MIDPRMVSQKMDWRYRFIRGAFRLLLSILCRLHIEGLERLPRRGPAIVVANHLHWMDPPVIMGVTPVRMVVLAAEKWETRPGMNVLFKSAGAVFVKRGCADLAALRKVEALLKAGAIFGVAPEGTRSKTGGLQRGKGGVALLAQRSGAIIAPIAVWGQERVFSEWRRLRRADVFVRVGEPFTLIAPAGLGRSEQLEVMTEEIMLRIARLLPPDYRGIYAAAVAKEEEEEEEEARAARHAGGEG
mgnify:CR=1 FL=1